MVEPSAEDSRSLPKTDLEKLLAMSYLDPGVSERTGKGVCKDPKATYSLQMFAVEGCKKAYVFCAYQKMCMSLSCKIIAS